MFSSCAPASALVAGVKITSGSLSARVDRQRLEFSYDYRTPLDLRRFVAALHHRLGLGAVKMVGNDVSEPPEPEIGHFVQYAPLVGYRIRKDHVEGRKPIAGDNKQAVAVHCIHIADLAAA